jgi:hypothetical protein
MSFRTSVGRAKNTPASIREGNGSGTVRRDLFRAESANPGFCETADSLSTCGTGLASAPQEATLALKTGPLLSRVF